MEVPTLENGDRVIVMAKVPFIFLTALLMMGHGKKENIMAKVCT